MKRIGVLTGGGDAPGLNSAIKWIVKAATFRGDYDVVGLKYGWRGLTEYDFSYGADNSRNVEGILTEQKVRTWDRSGGTLLKTDRYNPFNVDGKDLSDITLKNADLLGLDYIVAIGGEDTLGAAAKLYGKGLPVVGIPKTIDRDLVGTDYTIGFETAVDRVDEAINRLRTCGGSHDMIYVIEVMGRHAGHLALSGGIAGGAYIILIPEVDFETDKVAELLMVREHKGIDYSIVVVSEGAKPIGGELSTESKEKDAFGHETLKGIGEKVGAMIKERTDLTVRVNVPGHLVRGGPPNARDKRMARLFGIAAVDLIHEGMTGRMASWLEGGFTHVDLSEVMKGYKLVNVEQTYDKVLYNGVRHNVLNTSERDGIDTMEGGGK